MPSRRRRLIKQLLVYAAAIAVFAIMVFPLYALLLTSLQPESIIRSRNVEFFPRQLFFAHFAEVLRPGHIVPIRAAIANSLTLSLLTAAICLTFALPAAYALARLPVPGRRFILPGLVSIYFLPTILFMIPLFVLFVNWRLDDSFLGLTLLYCGFVLPFEIWILRSFIAQIPSEVEEAAKLDGCSYARLFWSIIIPLVRPGILAGFLFAFILAWIEFLTPLVFTQDLKVATVSLGLYRSTIDIQVGQLAAAAVLTLLPVALLTLVFQRLVTRVFLAGAER
jgi:ABC-type glycerol-3-phosphate transport system permease component